METRNIILFSLILSIFLLSGCSFHIPKEYRADVCADMCYSKNIDSRYVELFNQVESPVCRSIPNYDSVSAGMSGAGIGLTCAGEGTYCDCLLENGSYLRETIRRDRQEVDDTLNFEIVDIYWTVEVDNLDGYRWFDINLNCFGDSQGVYFKANGDVITDYLPVDLTAAYMVCENDKSTGRMFVKPDSVDYVIEVCLKGTNSCVSAELLAKNS